MSAAFQAFMEKLVDYTGLFPPASLPAETAIRNFIDYMFMPEKWLLGRFTCPAIRLEDLCPFLEDPSLARVLPLSLSVQSRSESDKGRFLEHFQADAAAVSAFIRRMGQGVKIENYEVRLPIEASSAMRPAETEALLEDMVHHLQVAGAPVRPIFVEVGYFKEYHVPVKTAIRALATFNRVTPMESPFGCGLKIRCAGSKAEDYPHPDQMCYTLITLVKYGVPFKAIGGLHHAFRRYNPSSRTRTFGFLSLMAAAFLAATKDFDPITLRKVLTVDSLEEFNFKGDWFSWREHSVKAEEIARLRATFAISLGTSSFVDLRHELSQMSLI